MALRVLLADESNTIKKVFQLALQDYAVEVKPVNVGLDVLTVAKKFQPDIVFADVLLQKKSGYDVSAELKSDHDLGNTPVVLMWSGFMDLDEDKYQASRANGYLEKPFDVTALRTLIQDLVPKTKTQKLSGFLSFPDMPEFEEPAPPAAQKVDGNEEKVPDWSMSSFDEVPPVPDTSISSDDDFKSVPLPAVKRDEREDESPQLQAQEVSSADDLFGDDDDDEGSQWAQHDLSRFRVGPVDEEGTDSEMPVDYVVPEDKIEGDDFLLKKEAADEQSQVSAKQEDSEFYELDNSSIIEYEMPPETPDVDLEVEDAVTPPPTPTATATARSAAPSNTATQAAAIPQLSPEKLEEIIRAQSKEVIESVVWKVIPDLATQIIERELKRLLDEREAQIL